MYYPGLVHETNTIKNTGVALTDPLATQMRSPHAGAAARHTTSSAHTLSQSLAPFTAVLSFSLLSLSLSLPLLGRPRVCARQ